ncbi:MAG: anthranilate synthase component I family protein [Desulfitobacterium sp.]|nr:anthranilate synthase component I family protein [Desulfitobacterium sp.]
MYLAQKEWFLSTYPSISSSWVLDLLQFAETLGEPCLALLEGNEKDAQRTYLAFGKGWVLTPSSASSAISPPQDPLEHLRSFIKEHHPGLECHSGIIGYLDYEWGLYWENPHSLETTPNYFFRLSPINLVLLPEEKKVILEVLTTDKSTLKKTFTHWKKGIEEFLNSYTFPSDSSISGYTTAHFKPSSFSNVSTLSTPPTSSTLSIPSIPSNSSTTPAHSISSNHPIPSTPGSPPNVRNLELGPWLSNFSHGDFLKQVERIQERIRKSDITQGVLSQRFTLKKKVQPWPIYQKLRLLNPSPWLFCVFGEGETLVGSSPELLVSTVGSHVQTRPIAGTRPRGSTDEEDQNLVQDLLQDKKERAEHTMLVELGQDEIRRVSTKGSVIVKDNFKVERFSHVMHIVSTVEGKLDPTYESLDALKTLFPAGTLTGSPKIKAMEILQDCEPTPRGPYGGALGIYRWNGDLDFCITIRTLIIKENEVSVQSGAGIVEDSIPEKEYQETLHKAQALFRAIEE